MTCYSCPSCGAGIPLADVNVGADIALCRACGARCHVAELVDAGDEQEETRLLSGPAPKHVQVIRDPNDIRGTVELVYAKVNPAALFVIPFALVWSGGSLGGIYGVQIYRHTFDWKVSLFGIPFVLGTFVLLYAILSMLFKKSRLALRPGHGTYSSKVLGFGKTVEFDLNRETEITVDEVAWPPRRGSRMLHSIRVKNGNTSETICSSWDDDALPYALAMLKRIRG